MKLFLYYALHSFKNQIKKLFKTWVIAFLAVCFIFGIVIGIGAAIVSNTIESNYENTDATYEGEEDDPTDSDENIILTEEDIKNTLGILELALGGITLLIFGFYTLTGDKNGSSIFCMADVNLLFSAPMKPAVGTCIPTDCKGRDCPARKPISAVSTAESRVKPQPERTVCNLTSGVMVYHFDLRQTDFSPCLYDCVYAYQSEKIYNSCGLRSRSSDCRILLSLLQLTFRHRHCGRSICFL